MSISLDPEPPVWLNKRDTDDSYNFCVSVLLKAVKQDVDRCAAASGDPFTPNVVPIENSKGWFGSLMRGSVPESIANEDAGRGLSGVPGSKPSSLRGPAIGVIFGTHNWDSCALILQELKRNGLAVDDASRRIPGPSEQPEHPIKVGDETVARVAIGQLYGA